MTNSISKTFWSTRWLPGLISIAILCGGCIDRSEESRQGNLIPPASTPATGEKKSSLKILEGTPLPSASPNAAGSAGLEGSADRKFAADLNALHDPNWAPTAIQPPGPMVTSAPSEISSSEPGQEAPMVEPTAAAVSASTPEPFLTVEELRELNSSGQSSAISSGGGGSGSRPRSSTSVGELDFPESDDAAENSAEELPYVDGQARGYALLALMQPEARPAVNRQLEALFKSRVKNLVISVLIDGTFSWDSEYFRRVLQALNQGERRLTLVVYLTNGATMRTFDSTPIRTAFSTISPEKFRKKIQFDTKVRDQFESLAKRARGIFDFNRGLNPSNHNVAVVMLEDNLDADSYRAARQIAGRVLSPDTTFVRNQCLGCWPGNDFDPQGDGLEFHTTQEMVRFGGAGFSLDGVGFHHNFEQGNGPDLEEVKHWMRLSIARGVEYFQLWRHDRQGIYDAPVLAPSQRRYAVPTDEQIEGEILLLREGLHE